MLFCLWRLDGGKRIRIKLTIVTLLLACYFAVVQSLNTAINQDRWNETPALFSVSRVVSNEIASDMFSASVCGEEYDL